MYETLKFLHVLGVVLLIGNVTITAFWKVMADRTGDAKLISHSIRNVIIADWLFTLTAILLLIVGGYGMALVGQLDLFQPNWLGYGQLLFLLSGLIWVAVLIPYQWKLSRIAQELRENGDIPSEYLRLSRAWLIWGIVATVPLVASSYLMVVK